MGSLTVAIIEDRYEDEQRLVEAVKASEVETRVVLFSEAPAFVEDYTPGYFDLILMDIYLERDNGDEAPDGVNAVRSVRAVDPVVPIAFVTTSKDHALDAYRLDVVRYLEKPVTQRAVDDVLRLAAEAKERRPGMVVRVDGRDVNVAFDRIVYLEQQGHYVILHLTGGELLRTRAKLAELLGVLDERQFADCHKSFVANLNFVDGVDAKTGTLKMFGGDLVPIRRGSKAAVRRAWEDWLFEMTRRKDEALSL